MEAIETLEVKRQHLRNREIEIEREKELITGVLEEFVVVVDEELEEEEGDGDDWSIATELVATVATLGAMSCDETIVVGGGDETNRLVRFCATGVVEMVVTFVEIVDGLSGVDGM